MIPYRVVRAIGLLTSTAFCCNDTVIEIVYTMVKIYPMTLPIICFIASKEFRQALEVMKYITENLSILFSYLFIYFI